ncbi:hypothetical protein AJ80_04698 [Polytolypa hystricis UAMH7299]|uniref:Major facilitator superfamily (MFS) profile domain-containing protein n=1 Tax=Polytolypa hystricis (strain UAMH7299) TaxID=1447883 RepID=A0A2B7Y9F3_POLH7|nr:hypothetical protein AJ80_04698 [Polytolypa hystricis UAMH7299]
MAFEKTSQGDSDGMGDIEQVEKAQIGLAEEEDVPMDAETKKKLRRIVLKVDIRLIPILGAMYAISGIDRSNITAARIAGMHEDLRFDIGNRFSIALLLFFVTYFFFEIPSNMILRRVGPARWLSFLAMSWGVVILGAGFIQKWTDMIAIRLLLGTFEAGFLPGCIYLISSWYERYQIQQRIAWFYAINLTASAFGNLLALGLVEMEGLGGLEGWRWIFVIEGIITCVLAILGFFLVIDFPDNLLKKGRAFLTHDEVALLKSRLERDRGDFEADEITMRKLFNTLCRWQVWIYALLFMCMSVASYGYSYFMSVIIQGMGYNVTQTYLLTAAPILVSIPISLIVGYFSDRLQVRAPFVAGMALTGVVGFALVAFAQPNGVRYFGVYLGVGGSYAALPACVAWQSNNIRGQSTKAIASALQVAFGAVGGVYASVTFMEKESPTYVTGLWAGMATQIFMVLACIGMTWFHWVQNKKAERGEIIIEGREGFRYTY